MLKSPYTSTLERQFVEPNVVDEKDVQNNQSKDQHNELDQLKAFYKHLQAHSHLNIQLKDLKNIKLT
jgi:hypothetical protein